MGKNGGIAHQASEVRGAFVEPLMLASGRMYEDVPGNDGFGQAAGCSGTVQEGPNDDLVRTEYSSSAHRKRKASAAECNIIDLPVKDLAGKPSSAKLNNFDLRAADRILQAFDALETLGANVQAGIICRPGSSHSPSPQ
jgi:hypothetical protein